jgi:membrane-bound lytic murein transglycosylase D
VNINYSVDLRLVSDLVGAPVDELEALNPSLLRMVTPPGATFDLHLPAGTGTMFQERIAAIPEAHRNSWRYHRVTADDTLASVARTYHVSEADLAAANQLSEHDSLAGIEAVVVPVPPAASPSAHTVIYRARRGDTLVSIADRFGLSLDQLRRWNHLAAGTNRVAAGQRLHVAEPVAPRRRGRHARASITSRDLHPGKSGAKAGTHANRRKRTSTSHKTTASAKQN